MSTDTHWHTTVDSPIGPLGLVATDEGLRAVSWRGDETSVKLPDDMVEDADHPILRQTAHQLSEYFDGDRTSFDLPLDLRGTPFQEAAWRALGDIPTAPPAATASRQRSSAGPRRCAPWAKPTAAIPFPSCCRATGSSAPTAHSPASAAVSTSRPSCCNTRVPSTDRPVHTSTFPPASASPSVSTRCDRSGAHEPSYECDSPVL